MMNQVATFDNQTAQQAFNSPAVLKKFNSVLNGRETQFVASLLSIINSNKQFAQVTNTSIMTAAMKAAVLNLPIEPSLGFAYIVPYKGEAQFQLGYKGLIQLAIRSGQFKAINTGKVHKAQLVAYDPLFETLEVDWTQPADEVIGYFATFQLLNGFKKLTFWTKEQSKAHGKRFSKTFNNGPWKTDFDAMAKKTALKDILSKYAPLSVEMQDAITSDNADSTVGDSQVKEAKPAETVDDIIGVPQKVETPTVVEPEAVTGYPADEIPVFIDEETGEIQEEISFFEGDTTNIKE